MKLLPAQIAGALRDPRPFAGLLIYGEDWGLVRDRALAAVRGVAGHGSSAFQVATLTREEHARLRAEAGSMALGGGRRVVHVQDAGDALVGTLDKLSLRAADVLVILESGALTARSKLRTYAERQAGWGAIACTLGTAGQVAAEIRAALTAANLTASPDAIAFLCQELAGESATRRSELAKLTLFAEGADQIDLAMAQLCCSSSQEASLGAAVSAAMAGRSDECDTLVAELTRDGVTGPGLLAVLSGQVQRFLKVRLLVDAGQSVEDACRGLMPPLYPRQVSALSRDVQRWRLPALEALGRAVREADLACKRAASPDVAIATRLLASVASRGR